MYPPRELMASRHGGMIHLSHTDRHFDYMKVVPFFPNQTDNLHCLQSCIESVLSYFEVLYSQKDVDLKTGFFGVMSWPPHSVNWLNELGLNVKLVSPFRYDELALSGEEYLKSFKGDVIFQKEKDEGQYNNLDKVKEASELMVKNNLWTNARMGISELSDFLNDENHLAIAKTVHEFLSGNAVAGTSHFVTTIKEYRSGEWLVHDPGLPPIERRKVKQIIANGLEIFGDIITVSKNDT